MTQTVVEVGAGQHRNAMEGQGWRRWDVEPWPEAVEGGELLDELARTVERFVVVGPGVAEAVSLWIIHTYAFELRDVTTYLGIESPQHRCGKSTLLDVLGVLVNRPVRAANISAPAFFRAVAETRPALLIDEADTFLHSDELRGILNSGYQRKGAFVMRVTTELTGCEVVRTDADSGAGESEGPEASEGENGGGGGNGNGSGSRLVKYSCWCPKAIARIGRLPQTLADRCVVLVMQRKLSSERCERLKGLDGQALKRKCARFVLDHAEAIASAQPAVPAGLNDRAADIWEPLLAVADLAGGGWPERARKAASGLSRRAQEGDPMGSLLMDIWEVFLRTQTSRAFTKTIEIWLGAADEDRPWMALKKGKKVTGQWLAQRLEAYGIRPKTMRIGEERAKGYDVDDFREAFRRYIPASEVEAFKAELRAQVAESKPAAAAEAKEKSEVAMG